LAGGLNQYQYTPNPTGWVDPLGLSTCPGGNGCEKPSFGEQDPTGKAVIDEGEPRLPSVIRDVDPNSLKRTHAIEGKASTKQVEAIASKMQKNGYDDDWPIDVVEHNGSRYIVDGHHRASAARRTHTKVTIELIKDLVGHHSAFNTLNEVVESADSVGHDRLMRPRR
jgi:uncharacterized protein RhaS with RHS repeats